MVDPGQDKFGDERNGCCCRVDLCFSKWSHREPVLSLEDIWLCVWEMVLFVLTGVVVVGCYWHLMDQPMLVKVSVPAWHLTVPHNKEFIQPQRSVLLEAEKPWVRCFLLQNKSAEKLKMEMKVRRDLIKMGD